MTSLSPDPGEPEAATAQTADSATPLQRLIRDAPWNPSEIARRSASADGTGALDRTTVWRMQEKPIQRFPTSATIAALARGLGIHPARVDEAAKASVQPAGRRAADPETESAEAALAARAQVVADRLVRMPEPGRSRLLWVMEMAVLGSVQMTSEQPSSDTDSDDDAREPEMTETTVTKATGMYNHARGLPSGEKKRLGEALARTLTGSPSPLEIPQESDG
ncbi:hypothetical protein [Parafrankia discariae]|uniref:hypothetical protein n=1 Tax=Parafrankia discariae TaxID=365528 RepID=UPI0003730082|nr:hypothetical protein [Parafrankia discariae]